MKEYVFERYSDDYKRLINQAGVKRNMPPKEGNEDLNAVWDGMVAPDGKFYYPLSSEDGLCGVTKLGWYDFENDKVNICFDGRKVLMPNDRHFPHSKYHTSLNTMPRSAFYPDCEYDPLDYLVIGTTHSTDHGPNHTEWMPFGHHNHAWEGFPGSQLLVYDPKNNQAMTLGTPVPRETIYGAKYEPKHNRLYMIGFMRGHVYCYDFNERRVIKDLGKAAEVFTYRLVLGADGHIYGCSKSGQLFKINTDTVELENMDFHVPDYKNNYVSYTWYRYLLQGRNHHSGKFMYLVFSSLSVIHKLDFETGEVTELGSFIPKDGLYELGSENGRFSANGFDVDKYGVLWFAVLGSSSINKTDYTIPRATYLIRWDIENGEEPYCCGIIGDEERVFEYASELEYDEVNDILYMVNTATERELGLDRPSVLGIDLKEFRKHYKEPGPVSKDSWMIHKKRTPEDKEEALKRFEARGGEENALANPFYAFPPLKLTPTRIWRSFPRLEVEESKVIGMAFAPDKCGRDYVLHVVCGKEGSFDNASYVLEVTAGEDVKIDTRSDIPQVLRGEVKKISKFSDISNDYKDWLRENILPQPVQFDENIKLPEAVGRRYRAKASCVVDWKDGKKMVGTLDAILSIVSPDGSVYSLGNAAAWGPIRAMVADKAKERLWGVAGDDEDLGYIFCYDEKNGLRQMGIINYNTHGYYDGPVALNVLSSICLSPDEKYLAIGSADRIAAVCVVEL